MRLFIWLVRAFVFFALFAFALNNQHEVAVKWFFGQEWHAPMVFVVLAAFGLGCALGVFAMVPRWWKHRRVARRAATPNSAPAPLVPMPSAAEVFAEHPPRDGL